MGWGPATAAHVQCRVCCQFLVSSELADIDTQMHTEKKICPKAVIEKSYC